MANAYQLPIPFTMMIQYVIQLVVLFKFVWVWRIEMKTKINGWRKRSTLLAFISAGVVTVGDDIFVGKFQLENRIHRKRKQ